MLNNGAGKTGSRTVAWLSATQKTLPWWPLPISSSHSSLSESAAHGLDFHSMTCQMHKSLCVVYTPHFHDGIIELCLCSLSVTTAQQHAGYCSQCITGLWDFPDPSTTHRKHWYHIAHATQTLVFLSSAPKCQCLVWPGHRFLVAISQTLSPIARKWAAERQNLNIGLKLGEVCRAVVAGCLSVVSWGVRTSYIKSYHRRWWDSHCVRAWCKHDENYALIWFPKVLASVFDKHTHPVHCMYTGLLL